MFANQFICVWCCVGLNSFEESGCSNQLPTFHLISFLLPSNSLLLVALQFSMMILFTISCSIFYCAQSEQPPGSLSIENLNWWRSLLKGLEVEINHCVALNLFASSIVCFLKAISRSDLFFWYFQSSLNIFENLALKNICTSLFFRLNKSSSFISCHRELLRNLVFDFTACHGENWKFPLLLRLLKWNQFARVQRVSMLFQES